MDAKGMSREPGRLVRGGWADALGDMVLGTGRQLASILPVLVLGS